MWTFCANLSNKSIACAIRRGFSFTHWATYFSGVVNSSLYSYIHTITRYVLFGDVKRSVYTVGLLRGRFLAPPTCRSPDYECCRRQKQDEWTNLRSNRTELSPNRDFNDTSGAFDQALVKKENMQRWRFRVKLHNAATAQIKTTKTRGASSRRVVCFSSQNKQARSAKIGVGS